MIGNDVVDLQDPETMPGATHARFDSRVFSARERRAIADSQSPDRERWLRWASKEATYKCLRARDPAVRFSPVELEVERTGVNRADVRWRDRVVPVRLEVGGDCVHAVAGDEPWPADDLVLWAVSEVAGADPSEAVRTMAVRELANALDGREDDLSIERDDDRVPFLVSRGRRVDASLSLSHHGRFIGFACELRPGARWGS